MNQKQDEAWWMEWARRILKGKNGKKNRPLLMPTAEHYDGTWAHTTVSGLGKVARLTRKVKRK